MLCFLRIDLSTSICGGAGINIPHFQEIHINLSTVQIWMWITKKHLYLDMLIGEMENFSTGFQRDFFTNRIGYPQKEALIHSFSTVIHRFVNLGVFWEACCIQQTRQPVDISTFVR